MKQPRHIGLIAGGGQLPHSVADAVNRSGDKLTILSLDPDCPADGFPTSSRFKLSEFGKMLSFLRKSKVTHICLAGHVSRPDFSSFKPDLASMRYLPGTLKAARAGDDALLRHIIEIFESKGFEIVSAQDLCASLLLPSGALGLHRIETKDRADALLAMQVIDAIGVFDIGQAAVVVDGIVLAVEAQEGTDAMLERVGGLNSALRGSDMARSGVLAKRLKPGQDIRVDMPTLGPKTVELAAKAGLSGIIAESGQAFVLDRDETVALADRLGLFIVGLPKGET